MDGWMDMKIMNVKRMREDVCMYVVKRMFAAIVI